MAGVNVPPAAEHYAATMTRYVLYRDLIDNNSMAHSGD